MKPSPLPFELVPRPSGFSEAQDCVVRALTNAIGTMPYAEAHALAKAEGRRDRCRTPWLVLQRLYGARCIDSVPWSNCKRSTLARWLREHPTGTYIVHVRGHVFAVRDGVQLDLSPNGPRRLVDAWWRFD